MLRVRLVGTVAVERDGASVPLPPVVARLLAYLAVRPGPHPREALAARFWPDADEPGGRASLRSAVWTLRRAVGDDALEATRSTLGLAPERVWVDLREIARLAESGDLAAAVAMCGGDALPDVDEDWAREARADHRARQAELLERLGESAEAAGDAAAAVRWSRLRCALDPLDEPAHVALIRRLAAAGDRAGGLVAGRNLAERLRGELGLGPGPAVRAVVAELHGPAVPPAPRTRPGSRRLPMFGRSAELAQLMRAWSGARDGAGRVVLVTGEAGIGKTRLISEVAQRVSGTGARVAVGAGVDVGGEAPLAVWQELARELVATVPAPPQDAAWPAELGRLAPDLAAALRHRGATAPIAAPELERLRIFDAVLRLVEWAARDRPVLVVAEDVHRADRASLALSAHIGRRLAELPVLFLLTRRDHPSRPDAEALLADLAGRGVPVDEIELGPLSEAELHAVTRSIALFPDDAVQRVVAAAEGNPLLAVERAKALAAGDPALPPTLRAAVRAAVGPLPPPARDLADALAVAGRALTPAELSALDLPDRATAEGQVLQTGLVHRVRSALGFRHALFAEAARADVADPGRQHERVGLAVEAAAGAGADRLAAEVARHLQQSGRNDLAGPRWERAARHARSVGALPEAAAFWTEAADASPDDPEPRLQLAEVYGWMGRRDAFEEAWEQALARVPAAGLAAAWCRRGHLLSAVLCHPTVALAAYLTARDRLPADAPASLRAEVVAGLAQVTTSAADTGVAAALLDEAALLVGDRAAVVGLGASRLLLLVRLGRFGELEDAAAEVGAAVDPDDRPDQWWAGLLTAASGLAAGGRLEAALRVAERALALAHGVPALELPCLAARAHLLSRAGRHDEAMSAAREQLAMARRLDSAAFAALASNDAGLVALAAGRPAEAAALLGTALDGGARVSRPASRLARAEALAAAGDCAEAERELRRAALEPVGSADQPWALVPRMARVQGLIARGRGDRELARRRLGEAIDGWERRRRPDAGAELMASLVDLGRPPVVGLVEPERELARLRLELAELEEGRARCPASS